MKVVRYTDSDQINFFCPSCDCYHGANSGWQFNGDGERPTFSPSFRSRGGTRLWEGDCHLWVRDGHLHYCDDHGDPRFRGKVVPMEEED